MRNYKIQNYTLTTEHLRETQNINRRERRGHREEPIKPEDMKIKLFTTESQSHREELKTYEPLNTQNKGFLICTSVNSVSSVVKYILFPLCLCVSVVHLLRFIRGIGIQGLSLRALCPPRFICIISFFYFVICALLFDISICAFAELPDKFYIYDDKDSERNHYIPSGWMGDWKDITFDDGWTQEPYSGTTCIRITYSANAAQGAKWAGIYWLYPSNNWATREGGFDLTGADKLVFWARGRTGTEIIDVFKVGGLRDGYPDSASVRIGPIHLSNEWQKWTIDLRGKNLSRIAGGFCWVANKTSNPPGCSFYLDEIRFE